MMQDEIGTITEALQRWSRSGREGLDERIESLYPHIKRLSHQALRREHSDHTLQTTEVAHLIYLRLIKYTRTSWRNRGQFFHFLREKAAHVLGDHARRKYALKRRGDLVHEYDLEHAPDQAASPHALEVKDFFKHLSESDSLAFEVMKRKVNRVSAEKISRDLGVSVEDVEEQWTAVKLQLATLLNSK
jgi:DNA-directed RNA polymerase specialized sigma24 family protein